MPVKCKLIGGKYRVVGPGGTPETNKAGTAVDGGGHATMIACSKQAAAINMNLSSEQLVVHSKGNLPFATTGLANDVQRFKKDMISVGYYIHPVHKWKLNVTPERLQRWLTNFKAMRENGVDVEVPLDHSLSAAKNLGYVVDAMLEPNSAGVLTMFGILEVSGKEAIDIVRRNRNVSIWVSDNYTDGKGNHYGEVIKHCSIVQQPIMPAQDDFTIAASSAAENANIPVYVLRSPEMDQKMLDALKKAFGLGDDATEETILSLIETHQTKQASTLETSQKEVLKLKAAAKEKAASAATGDTPTPIDPNTLELIGSTVGEKIKLLVGSGRLLPVVADKLTSILTGTVGSRNEMTLCLTKDNEPGIAVQIVEALKENDPIKIGEQTHVQALSRETPDNEEDDKADKDSGDAMMSGAGVEPDEKKKED